MSGLFSGGLADVGGCHASGDVALVGALLRFQLVSYGDEPLHGRFSFLGDDESDVWDVLPELFDVHACVDEGVSGFAQVLVGSSHQAGSPCWLESEAIRRRSMGAARCASSACSR